MRTILDRVWAPIMVFFTIAIVTVGILSLALLFGCGFAPPTHHRFAVAAPASTDRCETLDDRTTLLGIASGGLGALGGGVGLATVATESKDLRVGLSITSVVAASVAIGLGVAAKNSANSWVKEGCGAPVILP